MPVAAVRNENTVVIFIYIILTALFVEQAETSDKQKNSFCFSI